MLDKRKILIYNNSIKHFIDLMELKNMAKEKMVEQITSMDVDFAQWYTDVVKQAELVD